ncbi:roadblock/LC7 domain-containing protein [Methanocella sp. MCL-LM]|uniref:roadblock/LC7 domain-containing protein n=1 Tax=Methanocella sp. MCL-LM TaxID=3412035 RepID=UPI003C734CD3
MGSVEDVSRVIADLKRAGGIRALAVVSREGILVASEIPGDVHPETFAAMSAVMLSAAETAYLEIGQAMPDRLIVETDEGKLIITGAGERSMLVALADAKAGIGHLTVEMNRAVARLKELFG